MNADLVNGLFELLGAVVLWFNVIRVRKDKHVKGMNPWTTVFYSGWGFWNMYYYPALDQWLSFFGGLAIVTVNTIWLGHVFYYHKQQYRKYARKIDTKTYDIFNGLGEVIGVCRRNDKLDCWNASYIDPVKGQHVNVGSSVLKSLFELEKIQVKS